MILKAGETKDNVMTKQFWLKLGKAPQIHVRRALDNRIVFCANCEGNQTLGVSSSGNLSCSSCGSENWMHLSAPIIANFRKYDERKVQERIAVDRYMDTLRHEVFFTSNGAALV
jgi:hypothetical protein